MVIACLSALPPHFCLASAAAFGSFHRLQAQDMAPETDDNRPTWDAHCSIQPTWREQEHSMAAGYGRAPEAVAALPEEVLFIVAERDSPATLPHASRPRKLPPRPARRGLAGAARADDGALRGLQLRDAGAGRRQVPRRRRGGVRRVGAADCGRGSPEERRVGDGGAGRAVVLLSGWVVYITVREVGAAAGPP